MRNGETMTEPNQNPSDPIGPSGPGVPPAGTMVFHYIKSNHFRVVHADGVFGGVGPRGFVEVSLFSERRPVPKKIVHEATASQDGFTVGKEILKDREVRDGLIREVECLLSLSPESAIGIGKWMVARGKEALGDLGRDSGGGGAA